jgi:hypothetical protein
MPHNKSVVVTQANERDEVVAKTTGRFECVQVAKNNECCLSPDQLRYQTISLAYAVGPIHRRSRCRQSLFRTWRQIQFQFQTRHNLGFASNILPHGVVPMELFVFPLPERFLGIASAVSTIANTGLPANIPPPRCRLHPRP